MKTSAPCPACSGTTHTPHPTIAGLQTCRRCGGVWGQCYLGQSYEVVLPYWSKDPNPPQDRVRYFDFTTLGSRGIERRHGWYDTATKLIVQVG